MDRSDRSAGSSSNHAEPLTRRSALGTLAAAPVGVSAASMGHAALAVTATGPTYGSVAAGMAAVAVGGMFAVTNADATVAVYQNKGGRPVLHHSIVTTRALADGGAGLVAADDGARGSLFGTMQSFIDRLKSSAGAALVGWGSALAGGVRRTVADKLSDQTSVRDFGATGDGRTDDTAAIQAAVKAVLAHGGYLYFPAGTYRITAAITVPFATGWRMGGASRGAVTLVQAAANTPIFRLDKDLTHGWRIDHLAFTWASAQPQGNTEAIAIALAGGRGGGFFNWQVDHCSFANGFRGVATVGIGPVWGVHLHDCVFAGSMSGAAVHFQPNPAVGQPNINVENCMIDCAGIRGGTEFAINISYCDSLLIRNVELLNGAQPLVLMQLSQCNATLLHVRSENYSSNASTNTCLFLMVQSVVTVTGLAVSGVLGHGYLVVLRGDGQSFMTIHLMGVAGQTDFSGGLTAYAGNVLFVDRVGLGPRATDNTQTYLGYANRPAFNVAARLPDGIDTVGDASKAMTATSCRIQSFRATLTAPRTLTLPGAGMVVDMEIEVSRQAAAPGSRLTVADPVSGANFVFPPDTNGFVRYRYVGGAYLLVTSHLAPVGASGDGPPGGIPGMIGQQYIDTASKKVYIATGTASSRDWTAINP